MKPKLSVIIASVNGKPYLADCLAALAQQTGNITAEIIVIDCVGSMVTEFVTNQYPEIRLISLTQPQSIPVLRGTGIMAAQGEIIAITEDHCLPPADWYRSICQAHIHCANPAIGGAVDNGATQRAIDWAVFFCEYGHFMSPVSQGIVHDLPAPNVSYKANILSTMKAQIKQGYRETMLHGYLEAQGHSLWSDPSITMLHKKHFSLIEFIRERYHYSKAFAGGRNQSFGVLRRLIYCLVSPVGLPFLLLLRISYRVLDRKRHLKSFILSLPYLVIFVIVWAIGESVGYVLGSGDSELYLR